MRTTRKNLYEINYWPGFVDVLGTLLIVTIFTVLISTITQIYFNDQLEVKRGEISNLDDEIKILIEQLGGVTRKKEAVEKKFYKLENQFENLKAEKNMLKENLSKTQYILKMKNKELSDLVKERSNLLENIQKGNEKLETLSFENKKYEVDVFEMKRIIEKLKW